MNQYFSEFIKDVKKVSGPRKHKIKGSAGMKSAFLYYQNTRPKESEFVLTYDKYASIINEMNLLWIDKLLERGEFMLPEGFGGVKIRKIKTDAYIDSNGDLKIVKPIDMSATLKLWYEDKESFDNKTLVRGDDEYCYKIQYSVGKALFKNKNYFRIQFNRGLKKKLMHLIKEGKFDTFEKIKYNERT